MAKPLPWSHSTLSGFETCARQYEEIKVLRNYQDKKNDASLWGDEFHKIAEDYIAKAILIHEAGVPAGGVGAHHAVHAGVPLLPDSMLQYQKYLDQFVYRPGTTLVEREYGLDVTLKPIPFLDNNVWMRGIIDVLTLSGREAWVDDHKTGKRKKDAQQLIVFALLVFYHHPEVQTVYTRFHWVAEGTSDGETYHRHQIDELWATLVPKLQRYAHAFHTGVFKPSPSGLCKKHCSVETCEFYQRGARG